MGLGFLSDDCDSLISTTDVVLLNRRWQEEERFSGDSSVSGQFGSEIEIRKFGVTVVHIPELSGAEDVAEEFVDNGKDWVTLLLYRMELDSIHSLLRSYFWICLQKIQKYMLHISKAELWN
ncbi:hypothetical protein HHK36_020906 [Tetracentron sinense]|uniref:Uncharacterized protein n=1 Tax=Tetracentron sinense TaxID=13715 RepID=A0A834YSE2_TETSI|nr:hypothetical protein HHK36_020906 [Tetracentron sinense]